MPEIPDSSKWSSNKHVFPCRSKQIDLKYQIPASGVQTYSALTSLMEWRILKYQIPASGVQTVLLVFVATVTIRPEIPDSSKWSSNNDVISPETPKSIA